MAVEKPPRTESRETGDVGSRGGREAADPRAEPERAEFKEHLDN
jgi:hypothetical protein